MQIQHCTLFCPVLWSRIILLRFRLWKDDFPTPALWQKILNKIHSYATTAPGPERKMKRPLRLRLHCTSIVNSEMSKLITIAFLYLLNGHGIGKYLKRWYP
jgi:hypothetical protein